MEEEVRTGVCVVRAEFDSYIGLRLTVTSVLDVNRWSAVRKPHGSISVEAALDEVRTFLVDFVAGHK